MEIGSKKMSLEFDNYPSLFIIICVVIVLDSSLQINK